MNNPATLVHDNGAMLADNGGKLPPADFPPVDTGDNGDRDMFKEGSSVVLALELAACRLGISVDAVLMTQRATKALQLAEKGLYKRAIYEFDYMTLRDCNPRCWIPDEITEDDKAA